MTTTTMPAVSPETVTPLRPSEALRLGRLTRPRRIVGKLLDGLDGACALGAVVEGSGYRHLYNLPPFADATCPRCGGIYGLGAIAHLNDEHRSSDGEIVAHLQSLGL